MTKTTIKTREKIAIVEKCANRLAFYDIDTGHLESVIGLPDFPHEMARDPDGRTAYGTVILHVAPEATANGPLAFVQNGDMIEVDVEARRLHLAVDDAELVRRRAAWIAPQPLAERGYAKLYIDHVLQADRGADLDFLVGKSGAPVPRDNH